MKNLSLIILTGLFSFNAFSQSNHRPNFWIKQTISAGLAVYAGFTRHERDVIREKYSSYQSVWPNANPQWSNPNLSRYNKYKDGVVANGRKKIVGNINLPVFLTDKYHLSTTLIRTSYMGIVAINMSLYEKPNWKTILKQSLITYSFDVLGNAISTKLYNY